MGVTRVASMTLKCQLLQLSTPITALLSYKINKVNILQESFVILREKGREVDKKTLKFYLTEESFNLSLMGNLTSGLVIFLFAKM